MSRVAATGHALAGILGLLTALLVVAFSEPLLRLVGADQKLAGTTDPYFRLYAISGAPMTLSAVTSAVFRSINAPRIPLVITIAAVLLNTGLGLVLVLGLGPIPSLEVAGAAWATLISQTARSLALIILLYFGRKGVHWVWPLPGSKTAATATGLIRLTGPIAASEVPWGMSTFLYAVVFTRLGTNALAASQVVLSLESVFIVASAGLPPAAVAVIGHALGVGSLQAAKFNAWLTIRFSLIAAAVLGTLYAASGFLLPILYPKMDQNLLRQAFWGVLLMAAIQPAKVLSNALGNGVLASGSDTRFVLAGNLAGTYAIGLPTAVVFGLVGPFGFFGVFAAKVLEEVVKVTCFVLRFCGTRWYATAIKQQGALTSENS
jgi:putative MATE family efflux protein